MGHGSSQTRTIVTLTVNMVNLSYLSANLLISYIIYACHHVDDVLLTDGTTNRIGGLDLDNFKMGSASEHDPQIS